MLCWWRQFRVAPPEPVRPPLMHHQAVSRIAKARADEDMSLLDFVVAAADLRVQCIDAARDAAPGVEAMLRAGAEGVEAMQGLVATAQQQGARAARSRLECQQQRAATALDSTETRARLECAEARVADLEAMLREANAEAAACRGRMADLEDTDKDQQREEEVYGRLRQGCQAAAAKAQEALQVHTGCVACGRPVLGTPGTGDGGGVCGRVHSSTTRTRTCRGLLRRPFLSGLRLACTTRGRRVWVRFLVCNVQLHVVLCRAA